MLAFPDMRGEFIGAFGSSGGVGGGSAPASPPRVPSEVGLENRRVAAFVIMRSGGASAGTALAGAGSMPGAEPKGFMRLYQPGPPEAFGSGRFPEN